MPDEIAKKFAENTLILYGFGAAFFVVAVTLLIWKVATEEAPDWVKWVSLVAVLAGLTLILETSSSTADVKRRCENGDIPPEVCVAELHINPFPSFTLGPPRPSLGAP
jgi:hypothetical protein